MRVIYEAIFLDNDEILGLFAAVRGTEAPYPKMTWDFHVTTAFRPEQDLRSLYGTEVTVHITAYQRGEVRTDSGESTENEGFFGSVTTESRALREILDRTDRKWHITGSYRDEAKYTEQLDLAGAKTVDYTIRGRFGGYLDNGTQVFAPWPQNGKKQGSLSKKVLRYENVYFINGTAYAGKSTMVKLLAERCDGIACEENYHDALLPELDSREFPNLTYTRDLRDWADFIRRSPEEYARWVEGNKGECTKLELRILDDLTSKTEKKIFVDTNIPVEVLHQISDEDHVLIMLADPRTSVERFFDRPDGEKQFLYQLMLREPDPDKAIANFRACLERVNSPEVNKAFEGSGFRIIHRDDRRSIDETFALVKAAFGIR